MQKIRLAFLLDSLEVVAWQEQMLEILMQSDYADVVAFVLLPNQNNNRRASKSKLFQTQYWLYHLYTAVDKMLFQPQPNAFEHRILPDENLQAAEQSQAYASDFTAPIVCTNLDELNSLEIDILFNLSEVPSSDVHAQHARFGVWYFQHSDIRKVQSAIPGFWESIESQHATGSGLFARVKDDSRIHLLTQSWSSTDYYSPAKNRNEYYWKTLYFLPRKVQELYKKGCNDISRLGSEEIDPIQLNGAKIYTVPKNGPALIAVFKQIYKLVSKTLEVVFKPEHWFLAFQMPTDSKSSAKVLQEHQIANLALDLPNYKKIMPPRDRLWADPFFIERDDKYYLYIEDLPYKTWKGFISLIEIEKDGSWSNARKVLETGYHLSYPFLFEWEDELYMIPESHQNKTVELYKCTQFPDVWEFHMNLMEDIIAVDATLFPYNGKWWLFAGHAECEGMPPDDELFVFYADQPITTEWIPHPLNPVVSDIRFARPAGPIFQRDGKIIRPSQDSAKVYGHGLNFQEIEILTETDYRERTVIQIKPTWNQSLHGIHTFIQHSDLAVADMMMYRPKYWG